MGHPAGIMTIGKDLFSPHDLSKEHWLAFYSDHLETVEINNSYYQLPEAETLQNWKANTPTGFRFSVKASRYITHMKKLKVPHEPLTNFLERLQKLEDKLGPILFQLPPNWHMNLDLLHAFLNKLPEGYRYTFEFRDPSWFDECVYEMLEKDHAAFCIYELNGRISPRVVTTDWVYIRLHGPEGSYQGKNDVQPLAGWKRAFSSWNRQGKEVFCYFDNDEAGYAVQNALTLQVRGDGKT